MLHVHLLDLWLFLRRIALNLLIILALLVVSATVFYADDAWDGASYLDCFINSFYIMTVESVPLPDRWYLELMVLVLPLVALLIGAEAVVGATVMFLNKSLRRGEWNKVVASTYRDHTVVCGMGQLGLALCERLVEAGRQVVGVDLDDDTRGMIAASQAGVPTIAGDMTSDETLQAANVGRARYFLACSGDDLANLEAAVVAKRINPAVIVYARVYKESFAGRISEALAEDIHIFSPYATAAAGILAQMHLQNHTVEQAATEAAVEE